MVQNFRNTFIYNTGIHVQNLKGPEREVGVTGNPKKIIHLLHLITIVSILESESKKDNPTTTTPSYRVCENLNTFRESLKTQFSLEEEAKRATGEK